MNLTWHIIKKDFRRLRLPLLLWTGLLAAQAILCMRLFSPKAGQPDWFEFQSGIILVLAAVGWIFTFVVAAAYVLEDPLVGTQMFWVTRPIAGGRLLAAKALGILLALVVWPVIMALPSWVYFGLGGGDLLVAAERVVVVQLVILVVAVALSVVAGQGSRFLLWTLGLLAGVPLAVGVVSYHSVRAISPDVQGSRVLVVLLLLVVTALVVILLQYLGRRFERTVAVLAAGLALAVLVGLGWSWNLTKLFPRNHTQQPGTEGVELTVASGELRPIENDFTSLILTFHLAKLPAELTFLSGGRVEAVFHWADGTTLESAGTMRMEGHGDYRRANLGQLLQLPAVQVDPETEAKIKEMMAKPSHQTIASEFRLPQFTDELAVMASFPLDAKWAGRFKAAPPTCTFKVRVLTGHPVVAAEVRLSEGDDRIGPRGRLKMLRYGDQAPARRDQRGQKNLYLLYSHLSRDWACDFYEADHVRGTMTWDYSARGAGGLLALGLLPVSFDWGFVAMPYPRVWRTDKWVDMPDWLNDRTLVLVTLPPDGGFDRELKIDRLKVTEK